MCGIAGFIGKRVLNDNAIISKMTATLQHRGPDDDGICCLSNDKISVCLGHKRLSIIDLSSDARQPMQYKEFTIVFNGEIYNYREIRKKLSAIGHNFSTTSDTEVILHAFAEWGVSCVNDFIGMFAFVIYNSLSGDSHLFRDRAGVKPLYYYKNQDTLIFASELKALYAHPDFSKELLPEAVHLYFDYGYIPSPYSIFKNCFKLKPGHYLCYNTISGAQTEECFWSAEDCYRRPKLNLTYDEATSELNKLLLSAVSYRMVADVPVGVFLSSGYDSSLVTALLQTKMTDRLKTFTIGFRDGNNEAPAAKEIAEFLGTDHTEYYCSEKEATDLVPLLPYFYDEPFADSSAIPTMLVSKIARENVTVALSADAGDESFAGYTHYTKMLNNNSYLTRIPAYGHGFYRFFSKLFSGLIGWRNVNLAHKLLVSGKSLSIEKVEQLTRLFSESQKLPDTLKTELLNPNFLMDYYCPQNYNIEGLLNNLLLIDYKMYLEGDILTKVDRATMSVSLEGREPLLDHRILEFAARIPENYKLGNGTTKRIIRTVVHKMVPEIIMNRPKAGFSAPVYKWLNGDLSYLLDEFLTYDKISKTGILNANHVLKIKKDFRLNKLYYKPLIWKILMFMMWYETWMVQKNVNSR